MASSMEEIAIFKSGINKQAFETSLQRITDQISWIEQKLTLKIDKEISNSFQNQKDEINQTKTFIGNVHVK